MGGNPQCSPYGPRFLGSGNLGEIQHQLAGAQDGAPRLGALSRPSQEQVSDDQVGQSGDCLQPDQTGGPTPWISAIWHGRSYPFAETTTSRSDYNI